MNSPYQAKDLLPYEPERKQLRMDAVKNFRPYKPERQMLHPHTHKTPHNPPYDPEAVSSMQDSDEDPDPEIRKPQREFHELRREPKLAALQIKVQRQDPT
jgi:hypothetical protein